MKGGTVDPGTADEVLAAYPLATVTGKSGRYVDRDVVQFMGYPDDMPVSNFRQVPSYKRMCICIMKNDYFCKYAGFGPTKGAIARRRAAVNKIPQYLMKNLLSIPRLQNPARSLDQIRSNAYNPNSVSSPRNEAALPEHQGGRLYDAYRLL